MAPLNSYLLCKFARRAVRAFMIAMCALGFTAAVALSSDERSAFESARDLGTPAAFDAFLQSYPTGFYADLARAYLKKLEGQQDASPAPQPPYPAPSVATPSAVPFPGVTGFNLEMARHAYGAFVKNGPDTWVEQNAIGTGVFRFKEIGRTDAEVQLYDASRGVYLGLDVNSAVVWYSDAQPARRVLYQIVEARAGGIVAPPQVSAPPAVRTYQGAQRCPKGTEWVRASGNCRPIRYKTVYCKRGYQKIDGKCIKKNEAAGYCGPGYRVKGGKCVPGAYQAPPKGTKRPQWQIDAIKKGCKPGQGWNSQEGCHEND